MKSSKLETKTGIISAMDLKRTSTRVFYRFLFAFFILMVLFCLLPPLYVMLSSLKSVQEFYSIPPTIIPRSFEPYKIIDVWVKNNFGRHYINSLIMIAGCVASALVFNGMAGYTLAILKPRGYKIAVIMWSLMMPTVINIVPVMVNLTKIGLINSFLPLSRWKIPISPAWGMSAKVTRCQSAQSVISIKLFILMKFTLQTTSLM